MKGRFEANLKADLKADLKANLKADLKADLRRQRDNISLKKVNDIYVTVFISLSHEVPI